MIQRGDLTTTRTAKRHPGSPSSSSTPPTHSLAVLLLLFIAISPQLTIHLAHNTSKAKVCRLQRPDAVVAAATSVTAPALPTHAGAAAIPAFVAAHIAAVYRCCSVGRAFWQRGVAHSAGHHGRRSLPVRSFGLEPREACRQVSDWGRRSRADWCVSKIVSALV